MEHKKLLPSRKDTIPVTCTEKFRKWLEENKRQQQSSKSSSSKAAVLLLWWREPSSLHHTFPLLLLTLINIKQHRLPSHQDCHLQNHLHLEESLLGIINNLRISYLSSQSNLSRQLVTSQVEKKADSYKANVWNYTVQEETSK